MICKVQRGAKVSSRKHVLDNPHNSISVCTTSPSLQLCESHDNEYKPKVHDLDVSSVRQSYILTVPSKPPLNRVWASCMCHSRVCTCGVGW